MFSRTARSSLCTIAPSRLRHESPAMSARWRPSETSLIVKSNSFRAMKSMAVDVLRLDGDLCADHPDLQARLAFFERLRCPHIGSKGRRRCVQHDEVARNGLRDDVRECQAMGWCIDELRA